MSHFSHKINELKLRKKVTATQIEKTLGLSGGSWSRYERSLIIPSLLVAQKIADFFGVSLHELVGRNPDKSLITATRLKHADEELGPEECRKVWFAVEKMWTFMTSHDHKSRNRNLQVIETIVDLLHEKSRKGSEKALSEMQDKEPDEVRGKGNYEPIDILDVPGSNVAPEIQRRGIFSLLRNPNL